MAFGQNSKAGTGGFFAELDFRFRDETEIAGVTNPLAVDFAKTIKAFIVSGVLGEIVDLMRVGFEVVEFFDRLVVGHEKLHRGRHVTFFCDAA